MMDKFSRLCCMKYHLVVNTDLVSAVAYIITHSSHDVSNLQ